MKFIQKLCQKHNKEAEFDIKYLNALACYKNATFYGILGEKFTFKFIEIGFSHVQLAKSTPYEGRIHEELVSYASSEELQLDFLTVEFKFKFDDEDNGFE